MKQQLIRKRLKSHWLLNIHLAPCPECGQLHTAHCSPCSIPAGAAQAAQGIAQDQAAEAGGTPGEAEEGVRAPTASAHGASCVAALLPLPSCCRGPASRRQDAVACLLFCLHLIAMLSSPCKETESVALLRRRHRRRRRRRRRSIWRSCRWCFCRSCCRRVAAHSPGPAPQHGLHVSIHAGAGPTPHQHVRQVCQAVATHHPHRLEAKAGVVAHQPLVPGLVVCSAGARMGACTRG